MQSTFLYQPLSRTLKLVFACTLLLLAVPAFGSQNPSPDSEAKGPGISWKLLYYTGTMIKASNEAVMNCPQQDSWLHVPTQVCSLPLFAYNKLGKLMLNPGYILPNIPVKYNEWIDSRDQGDTTYRSEVEEFTKKIYAFAFYSTATFKVILAIGVLAYLIFFFIELWRVYRDEKHLYVNLGFSGKLQKAHALDLRGLNKISKNVYSWLMDLYLLPVIYVWKGIKFLYNKATK